MRRLNITFQVHGVWHPSLLNSTGFWGASSFAMEQIRNEE
jgi:hypothetical protein